MTGYKSKRAAALDEEGMYLDEEGMYLDEEGMYLVHPLVFSDFVPPQPAQEPQRTWVDLTDEEISDIAINNPPMVHEFARAVLAKSKEKNNG